MVFVELDQVVVVPTARREGVGRSLCTAVLDWAQAMGVDRVELSTWAFNEAAYRVFEGLGFAPTVRRMSRPTTGHD
ncbi:MAG: GNAT family N-acetyltransferase [Acidimicrobiales bacterium]